MNSIIRLSLRNRMLIIGFLVALLAAGGIAFSQLNIEAYPDPVPPMVEIVTQTSGLSAEEMERNVTIPIEVQMAGIPHLNTIRAISLFGLSDVKIQFTYDYTFQEAQQQVINRLSQMGTLPGGAQPGISPTSPIGEIFRYRVVGPKGYSVMDLKTLQDWVLERKFKAIPGVIDVTGWGGKIRSYQVTVDTNKLSGHGATVAQVMQAIGHSNANAGGQTINFGPQAAIVRGVGLIQSVEQINNVLVTTNGGAGAAERCGAGRDRQ
jgi:cobalt-zinc-cadmium resistance protein CzcA